MMKYKPTSHIAYPHTPHQTYHMVNMSPWPLTASIASLILMYSLSYWFHMKITSVLPIPMLLMSVNMLCWWRDVTREASVWGSHTKKVQQGLEWGMILFITSEVMFFSAFFWAFFHSSLAPSPEIGCTWPPMGVWPLNPFSIPLLNTATLLASGVTVTYAHHAILMSSKSHLLNSLTITVTLGWYFTYLQATEYADTTFTIADSVYGSTFFIATGFHGLHVLIGSMFLLVCFMRAKKIHFSPNHHFGFEAAAWYWHFVDVIWIFLFLSMYWWTTS